MPTGNRGSCLGRIVGVLLLAGLATGCAMTPQQKEQVGRFGKATATLGAFAADELPALRRQIIEMDSLTQVLAADGRMPAPDGERPISPDSARQRVAAAQALQAYGALLDALASGARKETLRSKAQDLVETFDSALHQGLSDAQRNAASGLIASLGALWLEKRKKDGVRAIVASYQQPVAQLGRLLAEDFTALGSGYLGAYTAVAGRLENRAKGVLADAPLTLTERQLVINALLDAEVAKRRALALEHAAHQAIAELEAAHAALTAVINDGDMRVESIRAYARSIQELHTLARVLTQP